MTKENEGQNPNLPPISPDWIKGVGKNEGQEGAFACQFCNGLQYGLQKLDYACIHLKVPRTGKPWLDALITESLRNEMAGRALTGNENWSNDFKKTTERCYNLADAMLSTGKGEE